MSLDVRTGELVAVIGPSGSGRSTLLKLVAGLETGHTGRIMLGGEDMSRTPVHQRHIGMVFQSYALFPHLSVLDNVAYGLKLRKLATAERRKRAQELLDIVGLGDYSQRAVRTSSRAGSSSVWPWPARWPSTARPAARRAPVGPRRQRARPSARPDPLDTATLHATTLLVTHDQEEALVMADRVAMLKDGRLLQIATPREIYENLASRAVAEFVGLSTILPAKVASPGRLDLGFAEVFADTGYRPFGTVAACWCAPNNPARPGARRREPPRGPHRRAALPGCAPRATTSRCRVRQLFLAESAAPAAEAIAIAPEHLSFTDH